MKRGTKIGWLLVALSVVLSVWVLIGSNSRANASDYTVEGGILTHYNGAGGDVNDIPSEVETIAASAFENNQNITSITIPSNVKLSMLDDSIMDRKMSHVMYSWNSV